MDPESFADEFVQKVKPLDLESNLAWWGLNTTGEEEYAARAKAAREEITRIQADPESYRLLSEWDDQGVADDPYLARHIRVLRLSFAMEQKAEEDIGPEAELETEAEKTYTNFRPTVRGKPASQTEIDQILRASPDEELRREAWEGAHAIGPEVEEGILELVEIRNRTARNLGYRDYYAMSLGLSEIDEDALFRVLDRLETETEKPFTEVKAELDAELSERFGKEPGALMPWHYADAFFQEAPPSGSIDLDAIFEEQDLESLTVRTYDGMGLDIRSLLENSDLYPREGKCQHAFCIDIDRLRDVRVLCNIEPTARWMGTMLHEFGHAVYDRYISPDLPFILKRPAHSLMTEAVAMLMQRLTHDPFWLATVAGVTEEEALELSDRISTRARLEKLIFVRWCMVMCHFERALYGDPDLDRNRLWWDLKERYQLLARPEGRNAPDWAAKIHVAVAPVYYQNYLLGDLVASQLEAHLRTVSSDGEITDSHAVGRALVDKLFRPGRIRKWRAALEHVTGSDLDPAHYLQQYRMTSGASQFGSDSRMTSGASQFGSDSDIE
jgi:peptidyl-dipeptidase A